MESITLLGLNTKVNDRDVKDGSLKENINLQWRDGSIKPVPNRLISDIDIGGHTKIIFHKVGDENQINVLGFNTLASNWLAADLAEWLGGVEDVNGSLEWFGTITNGIYAVKVTPLVVALPKTPGMSFTVLNGIIYFMGDGSSPIEEYYKRLQYSNDTDTYELKDMYAWKSLIPFYPRQTNVSLTVPRRIHNAVIQCGLISYRFALVLKSGEIVLHSPFYGTSIYGINYEGDTLEEGDPIRNIHTFINMDLVFANNTLLDQEITAINIYASVPYYISEMPQYTEIAATQSVSLMSLESLKGEFQKLVESPFYLVKTIEKPTDNKLLLVVGTLDEDIEQVDTSITYSTIDISTIAAGEVMPVDNFSYHKIFGTITSYNGRLIIESPKTILSKGHIRSLSFGVGVGQSGFRMSTEDGNVNGIGWSEDYPLTVGSSIFPATSCRGLLSYPDGRANTIGGNSSIGDTLKLYKSRRNKFHNISCVFNILVMNLPVTTILPLGAVTVPSTTIETNYNLAFAYGRWDEETASSQSTEATGYSSKNRVQFSAAGEFSVWPASNSYRIGEGKIMKVGVSNVNPSAADIITPLLVGTSDGVYTINLDPIGNNFMSSITRIEKQPYISKEVLQINNTTLFVSDKGLMAIDSAPPAVNITKDHFPDQGDGNFPVNETVLPNYNLLTTNFFGGTGNPYELDDIVAYLKGSLLSYDNRRKTIWASNSNYDFSLIYSIENKIWAMSTMVFTENIELFSTLNTDEGNIYSWYMVRENSLIQNNLLILSGEDMQTEVFIHMLTRPIKFGSPDTYKKIARMFSRCELHRIPGGTGYFSFGAWGKQDLNKKKKQIPLAAISDSREISYPDDVRQDIPYGAVRGKYKSITILQQGKTLPDSTIDRFDFDKILVDNVRTR